MPKVSIIMAVYNEEEYLERSIESILDQTFEDFEFIIIDDGSTDRTQKKLESFNKKDSRIKVFKNKVNKGIGYSLNKALSKCKGEYVARMDSHNRAFPTRLEKQVEFLDKNTSIGLVGTYHVGLFPEEKIGRLRKYPTVNKDIKSTLLYQPAITHSSIMVRYHIYEQVGGYRVPDYRSEDYDFYIKASQLTEFENIPVPLMEVLRIDYPREMGSLREIMLKIYLRILAMVVIRPRKIRIYLEGGRAIVGLGFVLFRYIYRNVFFN